MKKENQNKTGAVLPFRAKRYPEIAGLPRDFAESRRDEAERIRAEIQRESREKARTAAWAFASGMGWAAFVVIAFYQLTGGI